RGCPVQQFGGAFGGGLERHSGSYEGALEHSGSAVADERGQRVLGERVGEGEGGGEVFADAFLQLLGSGQGQQCAHALSSVSSRAKRSYAARMSASRSRMRKGYSKV